VNNRGVAALTIYYIIVAGFAIVSLVFTFATYTRTEKTFQGALIAIDLEKDIMMLDDETTPEVEAIEFDIKKIEKKEYPDVGWPVRVSYKVEGGKNVVIRMVDVAKAAQILSLTAVKKDVAKKYNIKFK